MAECPTFLRLPARPAKPRSRGLTHVLDSGLTPEGTRGFLGQAGHLVDIVKVGWGIGYVNPTLEERIRICTDYDCPVSLGGTLLEVAAWQGRVGELRDWALKVGMTHVEVSNGLRAMPAEPEAGPGSRAGRGLRGARGDRRQDRQLPADTGRVGRGDGR